MQCKGRMLQPCSRHRTAAAGTPASRPRAHQAPPGSPACLCAASAVPAAAHMGDGRASWPKQDEAAHAPGACGCRQQLSGRRPAGGRAGAREVTTVEYNPIASRWPGLRTLTPGQLAAAFLAGDVPEARGSPRAARPPLPESYAFVQGLHASYITGEHMQSLKLSTGYSRSVCSLCAHERCSSLPCPGEKREGVGWRGARHKRAHARADGLCVLLLQHRAQRPGPLRRPAGPRRRPA